MSSAGRVQNRGRLLSQQFCWKHGWMFAGILLWCWFSSLQTHALCSESTLLDIAFTKTAVLLVSCTEFHTRTPPLWRGFPGFDWATRRLLGGGCRTTCLAQKVEQSFGQFQSALHTVVCMQNELKTYIVMVEPCVVVDFQREDQRFLYFSTRKAHQNIDPLSGCPLLLLLSLIVRRHQIGGSDVIVGGIQ